MKFEKGDRCWTIRWLRGKYLSVAEFEYVGLDEHEYHWVTPKKIWFSMSEADLKIYELGQKVTVPASMLLDDKTFWSKIYAWSEDIIRDVFGETT